MDDTLAEELRQAIGTLVRAVRAVDTMPGGEAAILGYLDRDGPQTTAELAQRRMVSHQSAAKSVKELLGAGLVRAEPHPGDGRKVLLAITDAGRTRLGRERTRRATSLHEAIDETLTAAEQRKLRDCVPLLTRLSAHLTGR
ncbi:MarR family winged helix-turn-helix transcriptional regulator [Amycolatopsis australiensis]|uniref:DNA-binding transcriptional regulator, MarR family n=1 Tax=Amycolatopsis australiensis TaxID=546364 RepID=A0A1K1S0V5_9PSEU|nr:MarR family transcriptional regulator [Amycolatopsis australiensis]SFW77961.1 DNA-binding transcriptional regulator, MarR family [Amycolatopsis australiensis]